MSRLLTRWVPALALALAVCTLAAPLQGQSWKDKLKKKVAGAAGAVEKGTSDGASAAAPAADAAQTVEAAASVNYDFQPGSRVIFQDDFSRDPVGDIPARVKVQAGNWEVADFKGQRFLRSTSYGRLMIPLAATLPDRFTLELDIIQGGGWDTEVWFLPDDNGARDGHNAVIYGSEGGIGEFKSAAGSETGNTLYHARLMADGEHVKVYINNKRVANVPEAGLGRSGGIYVVATADDDNPFYITNIRIAASDRSLFDALEADGSVATHGILFATGSDKIQAESGSTLQEIGQMLQQHDDLKLMIEGHTDNVGAAAANLTLSQKRADAVRQYLVANFHVDGGRLQTKGYGDTKPVASNATDEGRQQNRRVVLVKL